MPERRILTSRQTTFTLDSYVSVGRARRKATRRYARDYEIKGLSRRTIRRMGAAYLRAPEGPFDDVALTDPKEREKIDRIYAGFLVDETKQLDRERDYSNRESARITFRASSRRNGLGKEERVQMYKDAGYTDREVEALTGKKALSSLALYGGLVGVSEGARLAATVHENSLPLLDKLPHRYANLGVLASVLVYTASYARFTVENVRSAKETGVSANAPVTLLYYKGRVFPNSKIREWVAGILPFGADFALHSALYTAAIEGTTGNPNKVIAANVAGIGVTTLYTEVSKAIRHRKTTNHQE